MWPGSPNTFAPDTNRDDEEWDDNGSKAQELDGVPHLFSPIRNDTNRAEEEWDDDRYESQSTDHVFGLCPLPISKENANTRRARASRPCSMQTPSTPPQPSHPAELFGSPETAIKSLIAVRKTKEKGFGIFAAKDIESGSILLSEKPLIIISLSKESRNDLQSMVGKLGPEQRKAFFALHAFHRKSKNLSVTIMDTNAFAIGPDEAEDEVVFGIGSRFNHQCTPNAEFVWDKVKGEMVWRSLRGLGEGEEVTISYEHEKKRLLKYYGFDCGCVGVCG